MKKVWSRLGEKVCLIGKESDSRLDDGICLRKIKRAWASKKKKETKFDGLKLILIFGKDYF
jgi:hypothetical protein